MEYSDSLKNIYYKLLILYLITLLFFYPYGICIGEDNNLRLPDLVAIACTILGLSIILLRFKVILNKVLMLTIFLFLLCELFFPLLGIVFAGGGVSGLGNSLRIAFLWLPLLLFVLIHGSPMAPKFNQKVNKIFIITIYANLTYCILQLLVKYGNLPEIFMITDQLAPFAVDEHYRQMVGNRTSGFFVNSTALSLFAIIAAGYFCSRLINIKNLSDILYVCLTGIIIVMSASRAALVSLILYLIIMLCLCKYKLRILIYTSIITALFLVLVGHIITFEALFERHTRIVENETIIEDRSLVGRMYRSWPYVLKEIKKYPWGTFVSPVSKFGLIDSGYLTYYAQGKWVFIFGVAWMLILILITGLQFFKHKNEWVRVNFIFLAIYLVGAMIISNPLRNPLMIFYIIFLFWLLSSQKKRRAKGFLGC